MKCYSGSKFRGTGRFSFRLDPRGVPGRNNTLLLLLLDNNARVAANNALTSAVPRRIGKLTVESQVDERTAIPANLADGTPVVIGDLLVLDWVGQLGNRDVLRHLPKRYESVETCD